MAKIDGTLILLNANGSPIAHVKNATLNLNMDLPDATDKDDEGWADHIAGLRDWSVDVDGLIDYSSSFGVDELADMIIDKETAAMEFATKTATNTKYTGTVSLSSLTQEAPQYAPATYSGSLVGKGKLTKGSVS